MERPKQNQVNVIFHMCVLLEHRKVTLQSRGGKMSGKNDFFNSHPPHLVGGTSPSVVTEVALTFQGTWLIDASAWGKLTLNFPYQI